MGQLSIKNTSVLNWQLRVSFSCSSVRCILPIVFLSLCNVVFLASISESSLFNSSFFLSNSLFSVTKLIYIATIAAINIPNSKEKITIPITAPNPAAASTITGN